jgi:Kef-type K+ transport system membrane component KefB
VVAELLLGVVIGPQALGVQTSSFIVFVSNLGLGMLFYFAGYEIDLKRVAGTPLRLAALGWALSLALAYSIGGVRAAAGVGLSRRDTGELRTRFGTYLLAAGALGEFGPILLLTLVLTTQRPLHNALILLAFVALAIGVALVTTRSAHRTVPLLERTLDKSSQLAVRWIVVLVFALAFAAAKLGLDLLLGGFAAGMITRQVLKDSDAEAFDSRLTAVAFGFFVPFFFVVSGMQIDIDALFASAAGVVKMVVFFGLFLVVRGTPALLLYRGVLDRRERLALGFFSSTQLPLVIAITAVAQQTGHMRASTTAALVGAAVLSTLVYPFLGLRLRGEPSAAPADEAVTLA